MPRSAAAMQFTARVRLAACAALLFGACPPLAASAVPAISPADPAAATLAAHGPAEVLGFLVAIDEVQIAAANLSRDRPMDPAIRTLAASVLAGRHLHLERTRELAAALHVMPVLTPDVLARRDAARAGFDLVQRSTDEDYGTDFLDALIRDLTRALDLIDRRLVSAAAGNEVLLANLRDTRVGLAADLLRAQELRSAGL